MDRAPHDVFTALERSGHLTGLTVALVGTESRMKSEEHGVALEFLGNRGTNFMWGTASVSYTSCTIQVSVAHALVERWFMALGALGTVGAAGGDRAPAAPGAADWSWRPAGQGRIAGLWCGQLGVGTGVECTVRIEPYHRHPSDPRAEVSACLSAVPNRWDKREAAWDLGVRFLGALCSGQADWSVNEAARAMVSGARARPASDQQGPANPSGPAVPEPSPDGKSPPALPG